MTEFPRPSVAPAAFEGWCAAEGVDALNATAFGKAMMALGHVRRKVGGAMRYPGLVLAAARSGSLRVAVDNTPDRRALSRMATVGAAAVASS